MRFRVVRAGRDDSRVPERLSDLPVRRWPAGADAPARTFRFTRGACGDHDAGRINGRRFDPERMDAAPLGRTEIWRFVTDVHHPVHVHLVRFQVLRRGGSGPGPHDGGWKDTVDLRPAESRTSRSGSPATAGRTCCTATTSSTRTWP